MDNFKPDDISVDEVKDVNIQCDYDCDRDRDRVGGRFGDRRPVDRKPIVADRVEGARGVDSSLLFFFLLLVAIVCQSDCDVDLDTLLWFFLLLVVIYNRFDD